MFTLPEFTLTHITDPVATKFHSTSSGTPIIIYRVIFMHTHDEIDMASVHVLCQYLGNTESETDSLKSAFFFALSVIYYKE